MTLRKTIFWLHLACGVVGGLAIGIMCFTGTVLAFEKELAAWGERDARRIEAPPAGAVRLTIDEAQRKLRGAFPDARPASMVIANDPGAAFAFPGTRAVAGYYVDPYTGGVRQPQSTAVGRFMQTMLEWHRYLGFTGTESRPRGKWINGACNLAFCGLAVTGLYLWMPRTWSRQSIRPAIWFTQNASGRARDWNWHNVIGFWSAPILIVLTLTAVPISFQWGGRVINALTGTPQPSPPAAGGPGRGPGGPAAGVQAAIEIPAPAPGTVPLGQDALIAAVQREIPRWKTITARVGDGGGTRAGGGSDARVTAAATFTVREAASWPRTVTIAIAVNPYTGEILRRTGYAEMAAPQKVRAWTRFLHTGEALGWGGQIIAALACAGGCVLVWTGLALAGRRFFGKRPANGASVPPPPTVAASAQ